MDGFRFIFLQRDGENELLADIIFEVQSYRSQIRNSEGVPTVLGRGSRWR